MKSLSSRVISLCPSATLAMAAKANELREKGIDIISFATGEPDFTTPAHIINTCKKALDEGLTHYAPNTGSAALKEAIAQTLFNDQKLSYTLDQIAITCGAKHAIANALLTLLNPGDEVIIPAPYWVSYPDQVQLADGVPVIVQTTPQNNFKLTPELLKNSITAQTKAIILNYPSNPTGNTYSKDEFIAIATIIVEHDLWIISDEIYDKLLFSNQPHVSIASINHDIYERTLIINGVSKSYAMTGWRMGYIAGNNQVISAINKLSGQQITSIPPFIQSACVSAFLHSQSSIDEMTQAYIVRRDIMIHYLNQMNGVHCKVPDGTFYLFPDISHLLGKSIQGKTMATSEDIVLFLLDDAHIATVSGHAFGAPHNIRLSFATNNANIQEGMKRMHASILKLH